MEGPFWSKVVQKWPCIVQLWTLFWAVGVERSSGGSNNHAAMKEKVLNDQNKTELIILFANEIILVPTSKTIVVNKIKSVTSNIPSVDTSSLSPCTQEKADTCLFLHLNNMCQQGYEKICIVTYDIVIVIALYMFYLLPVRVMGLVWDWASKEMVSYSRILSSSRAR